MLKNIKYLREEVQSLSVYAKMIEYKIFELSRTKKEIKQKIHSLSNKIQVDTASLAELEVQYLALLESRGASPHEIGVLHGYISILGKRIKVNNEELVDKERKLKSLKNDIFDKSIALDELGFICKGKKIALKLKEEAESINYLNNISSLSCIQEK
ncbi:hypothetical protein ACJJIQ_14495 [Microbulbifer sp. ANSA003]|uniref:hypothetical protein n=1 Tax=unclassified Microbulbifer TaxID=2619833 RepID=UPI00403B1B09